MLLHSLERTGGQEEAGVIGFKKELYQAVLERLGGFEMEPFYVVATLLDPRYEFFHLFDTSIICCRQKNQFYRLATTSETALGYVVQEVEKELANDKSTQLEVPLPVVTSGPSQSSSSQSSENSLQAIRNKFRLKKQEVNSVYLSELIFV